MRRFFRETIWLLGFALLGLSSVCSPAECQRDGDCELHTAYSDQCFASPLDMRALNRSDKPFALIQCDRNALVPVWRTAPLKVQG